MEGNIDVNVWKPKVWRSGGMWNCSYYQGSRAGAYCGPTPADAYAAWKWRDELRRIILKEHGVTNQGEVK